MWIFGSEAAAVHQTYADGIPGQYRRYENRTRRLPTDNGAFEKRRYGHAIAAFGETAKLRDDRP